MQRLYIACLPRESPYSFLRTTKIKLLSKRARALRRPIFVSLLAFYVTTPISLRSGAQPGSGNLTSGHH
jgi:hypothetical protein